MRRKHIKERARRGAAIIVLTAILLVLLFAMVSFSVDIGYVALVRTQLQRAADAAAHAAAYEMTDPNVDDPQTAARLMAQKVGTWHQAAGAVVPISADPQAGDVTFGWRTHDGTKWNYAWDTPSYNCVRVRARRLESRGQAVPLFFAAVLGIQRQDIETQSIAAINPRDIVFIIDQSGSMHHDSEICWSRKLLNWLSGSTTPGTGDGDKIAQNLWDDLGLTGNVPYPWEDALQTPDYRFDANSRNNIAIELPQLDGKTVTESSTTYRNTTGAGSSEIYTADGKIYAKLSYTDIDAILANDTITSAFPESFNGADWEAQYAQSGSGATYIKNYDFVIDQYLTQVMQYANPPVSESTYRDYWRGYVGYTRGYSSGAGSSNGIDGFANPSSDSYAYQMNNLYAKDTGETYGASQIKSDFLAHKGKLGYETYVQFMMDHGFNCKVGRDDDGNSSKASYTPMSMRWETDGGNPTHAYRRYDPETGCSRPPREQPATGVIDAVIAGINEIKTQNETAPEQYKDKIAVLIFHSKITAITGVAGGDPFTSDYDSAIAAVVASAGQSLPNASSNVDTFEGSYISGSTNTMHAMWEAGEYLSAQASGGWGRPFTNKVALFFTDGEANTITSSLVQTIDGLEYADTLIDMDLDGNGEIGTSEEDLHYYYSQDASEPKNATLKAAKEAYDKNVIIHTVIAGVGRDRQIGKRLSGLTGGLYRDSGGAYSEYAAQLVEDFKDVANHRQISLAIEE